jgi:two-component system OmpR family response regulator
MRILLVEDDDDLALALAGALGEEGYTVERAADGAEGLYRAQECDYDAVLLDLMLPELDGRLLLRRLRLTHDTPVLVLTARSSVDDRVGGLDDGADDYLTKPFELEELLARLRALLRRPREARGLVVELGEVEVDLRAQSVRRRGVRVELTRYEYLLLEVLVLSRGYVVTRLALEERLYEEDREVASNSLEVLVSRLRRKLGRGLIETRRGVGYRID